MDKEIGRIREAVNGDKATTLVVLSDHGFVSVDKDVAPLRAAVEQGRARVFIDDVCEAELARVLAYPLGRLRLDAAAQAACLAPCRGIASPGGRAPPASTPRDPACAASRRRR